MTNTNNPIRDCDIEFGEHDHDDEECARILANMNPTITDSL